MCCCISQPTSTVQRVACWQPSSMPLCSSVTCCRLSACNHAANNCTNRPSLQKHAPMLCVVHKKAHRHTVGCSLTTIQKVWHMYVCTMASQAMPITRCSQSRTPRRSSSIIQNCVSTTWGRSTPSADRACELAKQAAPSHAHHFKSNPQGMPQPAWEP